MITARTYSASLKPSWTREEISDLSNKMVGSAIVFGITHDKDIDENGELVEAHTHLLIDYETPRKITTVSNLLGVADNFIEVVKNKKGFLRYLTHMDEVDKYKYSASEVITNSDISYDLVLLGNNMTEKEIAKAIMEGKGYDLIGIVSSSKLRTIQAFIHYDQNNNMLNELRALRSQNEQILDSFNNVREIVVSLTSGVNKTVNEFNNGLLRIAMEIKKATSQTPRVIKR